MHPPLAEHTTFGAFDAVISSLPRGRSQANHASVDLPRVKKKGGSFKHPPSTSESGRKFRPLKTDVFTAAARPHTPAPLRGAAAGPDACHHAGILAMLFPRGASPNSRRKSSGSIGL